MEFLTEYDWPGNVRELMNVLRSAVLMVRGQTIGLEVLSSHPIFWGDREPQDQQSPLPTSEEATTQIPTLAQAELELIQRALQASGGNKSQAARILGISRSHLRYRMMLHGL